MTVIRHGPGEPPSEWPRGLPPVLPSAPPPFPGERDVYPPPPSLSLGPGPLHEPPMLRDDPLMKRRPSASNILSHPLEQAYPQPPLYSAVLPLSSRSRFDRSLPNGLEVADSFRSHEAHHAGARKEPPLEPRLPSTERAASPEPYGQHHLPIASAPLQEPFCNFVANFVPALPKNASTADPHAPLGLSLHNRRHETQQSAPPAISRESLLPPIMKDQSTPAVAKETLPSLQNDVSSPSVVILEPGKKRPRAESFASAGPAPASNKKAATNMSRYSCASQNTFVHKLYDILRDGTFKDYIFWSYAGDSFRIPDVNLFKTHVLAQCFKHTNFSSFVRQLNMYGFHKINKTARRAKGVTEMGPCEFQHNMFLRDCPQYVAHIKRRNPDATTNHSLFLEQQQRHFDALPYGPDGHLTGPHPPYAMSPHPVSSPMYPHGPYMKGMPQHTPPTEHISPATSASTGSTGSHPPPNTLVHTPPAYPLPPPPSYPFPATQVPSQAPSPSVISPLPSAASSSVSAAPAVHSPAAYSQQQSMLHTAPEGVHGVTTDVSKDAMLLQLQEEIATLKKEQAASNALLKQFTEWFATQHPSDVPPFMSQNTSENTSETKTKVTKEKDKDANRERVQTETTTTEEGGKGSSAAAAAASSSDGSAAAAAAAASSSPEQTDGQKEGSSSSAASAASNGASAAAAASCNSAQGTEAKASTGGDEGSFEEKLKASLEDQFSDPTVVAAATAAGKAAADVLQDEVDTCSASATTPA